MKRHAKSEEKRSPNAGAKRKASEVRKEKMQAEALSSRQTKGRVESECRMQKEEDVVPSSYTERVEGAEAKERTTSITA